MRPGNASHGRVPLNVYPTNDGYVAMNIEPSDRALVCGDQFDGIEEFLEVKYLCMGGIDR